MESTIILNKVKLSAAGTYKCNVFSGKTRGTVSARLKVIPNNGMILKKF